MKKRSISLCLVLLLSIIFLLPSAGEGEIKVFINGKSVPAAVELYKGIPYISPESLVSPLGIKVNWKNQKLYINDKLVEKTKEIDGIVYIPATMLGDIIGGEVELEGNNIKIKTSGKVSVNPTPKPTSPPLSPSPNIVPTPVVTKPTPSVKKSTMFIPVTGSNDNFCITVTNLEYANIIKNYYTPKTGYRFCILNISQQNISSNVQVYTGTFSLIDKDGHSFDYLEGLSNFWLQVLQPGGTNFGHLVYEIPADAEPDCLILSSMQGAPLNVDLFKN
ncbi:MAG: Telomeric repeat-binding factor 2 [bacterium ADurb.Bin363]|nr:MAG: Telomeric repeat-binding factor 2 [bacterium ADurb.Bin363]